MQNWIKNVIPSSRLITLQEEKEKKSSPSSEKEKKLAY